MRQSKGGQEERQHGTSSGSRDGRAATNPQSRTRTYRERRRPASPSPSVFGTTNHHVQSRAQDGAELCILLWLMRSLGIALLSVVSSLSSVWTASPRLRCSGPHAPHARLSAACAGLNRGPGDGSAGRQQPSSAYDDEFEKARQLLQQ